MRDSTRTRMREREKKKSESESWGEGEREFIRNVTPQSCRSAGTQGDRQEFCQEFFSYTKSFFGKRWHFYCFEGIVQV